MDNSKEFLNTGKQNIERSKQYSENAGQYPESGKNSLRIARGYRLKVSTHNLIKNLSEISGLDSDTIITQACLLLYKKIITEKEINFKDGSGVKL